MIIHWLFNKMTSVVDNAIDINTYQILSSLSISSIPFFPLSPNSFFLAVFCMALQYSIVILHTLLLHPQLICKNIIFNYSPVLYDIQKNQSYHTFTYHRVTKVTESPLVLNSRNFGQGFPGLKLLFVVVGYAWYSKTLSLDLSQEFFGEKSIKYISYLYHC